MGGGALLFCPPEIIQFKLLYSTYWSILFMNEGRIQLAIKTKTNYPLTMKYTNIKHLSLKISPKSCYQCYWIKICLNLLSS